MKRTFTLIIAVFMTATLFAQAPEKMSYQAVVRNAENALVSDTEVGLQISILQGAADGTAVYVETHTATTNENGLVSLEIGQGTASDGAFADIDWADGPYFIQTEIDPAGGTSYTVTGTSELLSVPYALHAKTAESVVGGTNGGGGGEPQTFEVGQEAQGGIVFYVTPDGRRGLVVAKQDQTPDAEAPDDWVRDTQYWRYTWQVQHPNYHDDDGKNYTDWRLPTLWELQMLYDMRDDIGGFITDQVDPGDEEFGASWYLTGTEYHYNLTWGIDFNTGTVQSGIAKSENMNIRAVRDIINPE